MTGNPHGYGQYPVQQPPSQLPFPQSSTSSFTQANSYGTATTSSPFTAAANAYNYNASRIPGLGLGAPSIPSTSYRPNSQPSWQVSNPVLQPKPMPPAGPEAVQSSRPAGAVQQNHLPEVISVAPVITRPQTSEVLEEGELSEGEFEDLYEPRESNSVPGSNANHTLQPSGALNNQHDSAGGDADGSSIYDAASPHGEAAIGSTSTSVPGPEQEYLQDEDWEPTYPERERSGSYSPYLSPREIHRKISIAKPVTRESKLPGLQLPSQPSHEPGPIKQTHHLDTESGNKSNLALPTGSVNQTAKRSGYASRSIAEAKKKAQEAILDYIDEGLDATLVKKLFADLGLETSPVPKPVITFHRNVHGSHAAASSATSPSSGVVSEPQGSTKQMPNTSQTSGPDETSSISVSKAPQASEVKTSDIKMPEVKAAKTAAEERKDKIARKLAAMGQKTSVSQPPPPVAISATATQDAPSAPQPTPTTALATEPTPASAPAPTTTSATAPTTSTAFTSANAPTTATAPAVAPASMPATPLAPTQSTGDASAKSKTENSMPAKAELIAANNAKLQQKLAALKAQREQREQLAKAAADRAIRPRASEFMSYSPKAKILKRTPMPETNTSFIIDVSDDEDVEMDIGSPADEPDTPFDGSSHKTAIETLASSDTSRQPSSGPTPPGQGVQLGVLAKRIEETKRLIAEAEAKKAAKRAIAKRSPQSQSPAVSESMRLPKVAEVAARINSSNVDRRNRIASLELPLVEAQLLEKQARLKQLVEQADQLKAEVQASMDARRRLAAEMEELVDTSEGVSLESAERSSLAAAVPTDKTSTAGQDNKLEEQAETQKSPARAPVGSHINGESEGNDKDVGGSFVIASNEDSSNLDTEISRPNSSLGKEHVGSKDTPQEANKAATQPEAEVDPIDTVMEGMPEVFPSEENQAVTDKVVSVADSEVTGSMVKTTDEVPMQTSAVHLPRSDDSYKPHPAQISTVHDSRRAETESGEVVDPVPDEPNPSHTAEQPLQRGQEEMPSGEDKQEVALPIGDLMTYHSPLGYFRAYRFHPKFFDEVSGGLKSMTYSSRIDPMQPLCPYALSGEECPDGDECHLQHFEQIALSDAEIITQLGSADMFTGETRNRFIDGLKRVLNELKAHKVKDFDRITRAIVKHRQEFLDDRSKVLALDTGSN
ncbi:hypothetical protein GGR56DRAFT_666101 [Xylariaceae sp. FL0804]|nr:hypothetical protein GGR56DRAFT_666101 [Xylariaceae sp. FL0804]